MNTDALTPIPRAKEKTAMIVKAAMNEGGGSLALYSGAILSLERGEFAQAIDALDELEQKHPASVVLPRSMLLRATLLVETAGRQRGDADRVEGS